MTIPRQDLYALLDAFVGEQLRDHERPVMHIADWVKDGVCFGAWTVDLDSSHVATLARIANCEDYEGEAQS